MKLNKSLVSVSAATAVALAGAPLAMAADAPAAPAGSVATEAPANGSSSEETDTEGTETDQPLASEDNPELKQSVDGSFGWDAETTGVEKFLDVVKLIAKVVGFIPGVPSSSALSS